MVLEDMKIKVNSLEENKIILDWAYEQGYEFNDPVDLKKISLYKEIFLYFRKSTSKITYSFLIKYSNLTFFKNHEFKEIFIHDIIKNNQEEIWF